MIKWTMRHYYAMGVPLPRGTMTSLRRRNRCEINERTVGSLLEKRALESQRRKNRRGLAKEDCKFTNCF